jgi:hypothetical protein
LAVAAAAALVCPWAIAGNQEVAEQIAATLRDSGQLHGYRIGVKYQDGTVWLKGQVATRNEMSTAMQLVFGVPGVTRVVNHLTIPSEQPMVISPDSTESPQVATPLQGPDGAVSAEKTPRPAVREMGQPNAREAAPNQAERLATNFASPREPEVAVTGLQEPTLAPPKPPAEPTMKPAAVRAIPAASTSVKPAAEVTPAAATTVKPGQPMPLAYTQSPLPMARANGQAAPQQPMAIPGAAAPARYDQPNMPNYAWPSYAAYPNYAAVTYPRQYSPTAWPYIGPFYPYPQVPLGWRKVTLEWHDGWWALDFDDGTARGPFSGLYRPCRRKY